MHSPRSISGKIFRHPDFIAGMHYSKPDKTEVAIKDIFAMVRRVHQAAMTLGHAGSITDIFSDGMGMQIGRVQPLQQRGFTREIVR